MKTIPLDPIYKDERFLELPASLRFFVINAVYRVCRSGKLGASLPDNMRKLFECPETTYRNHNVVMRSILETVLPEIEKIKNSKSHQVRKAHAALKEKAINQRVKQFAGTLAESITHNPAPLMTQHSAEAEQLRRQRNLHPIAPRKPSGKPPVLTE